MKCSNCHSEWNASPQMMSSLKKCPFCGKPLTLATAQNTITLESVLSQISADYGLEPLRNGRQMIGFFTDLAPSLKRESRMLMYFVEAGCHSALFNARNSGPADQRLCMERSIRKMVDEYIIDEGAAKQVCEAYWIAIGGMLVPSSINKPDTSETPVVPESVTHNIMPFSSSQNALNENKAVQSNDAASALQWALAYSNGEGVEKNLVEAAKWYRKAAELGNAEAQTGLGTCYYYGRGLDKDYEQSIYWYRKAAEQGYAKAQNNLGLNYSEGKGVAKDHQQAACWYRKAAEQGDDWGQNNLGVSYYNGEGVQKDYQQAVYWYRKAAAQGNVMAQRHLGNCYYDGHGVDLDYQQAAYWFNKAAENGDFSLYLKLGHCYAELNDLDQAIQCYQKASDKGGRYVYMAWYYEAYCYAKRDANKGVDRAAAELKYTLALSRAESAKDTTFAQKIRDAQKELKKKKSIFGWLR